MKYVIFQSLLKYFALVFRYMDTFWNRQWMWKKIRHCQRIRWFWCQIGRISIRCFDWSEGKGQGILCLWWIYCEFQIHPYSSSLWYRRKPNSVSLLFSCILFEYIQLEMQISRREIGKREKGNREISRGKLETGKSGKTGKKWTISRAKMTQKSIKIGPKLLPNIAKFRIDNKNLDIQLNFNLFD